MTPPQRRLQGHRSALALSAFAALLCVCPKGARAEAVDPGATWAPPAQEQEQQGEPERAEAPVADAPSGGAGGAAGAVAEDDSVSQGRAPSAPYPSQEAPSQAAQAKPRVSVVLLHQALGKPFDLSVIGRIMEPLVAHVAFVPLPQVKKAVARTRLPPSLIHLPKNLARVGRSTGADYTLVVEAVGHGRTAGVFAGLVNVHTGETIMAKRVPMPTRTLTNSQAIVLVDLIINALGAAEPVGQEAPAGDSVGGMAPGGVALGAPRADDGAVAGSHDDAPVAVEGGAHEGPSLDANGLSGPRVGRLMLGLALGQRVAHLVDTQKTGITPPQYAGTGNNTNPFFPGFQLDGEAYSGLITKHRRAWYANFGLALHLTLAPVLSYTQDTATKQVTKLKSTVSKMDIYAMYRLLLTPSRPLTPSIALQVGVSRFAFPLSGAQFPGVAFMAPHIGVDIQLPVHRSLVLHAGGSLRPMPQPSGEAAVLLGKKSSGMGFVMGGGLLGSWRIFEAGLRVNFEKMAMGYTGVTKLNGTPTATGGTTPIQFTNIKLTDQLLQVLLTLGVAY